MTTTTDPTATSVAAPVRGMPARTAVRLTFVGLVLGTIGDRVLGLWHPEPDDGDQFSYGLVSGMRDTWWAMHFFGGMTVSLGAVTFSALVLVLVRARGLRWATAGAVLLTLGGLFFAAGLAGEGVVDVTAADPAALPRATGAGLLDHVESNPERYLVGILPGLALSTLGVLLLAVALWRSGRVGRFWPVLLAVGVVTSAAAPFGLVAWALSTVSLTAATLVVGWRATTAGPFPEEAGPAPRTRRTT